MNFIQKTSHFKLFKDFYIGNLNSFLIKMYLKEYSFEF